MLSILFVNAFAALIDWFVIQSNVKRRAASYSNRYTIFFTMLTTMILAFVLSSVYSSLEEQTENVQADVKNILSSLGLPHQKICHGPLIMLKDF